MAISDQIIEVMEYLSSKLGIAIDWTSETAVPVIEEIADKYIRWEINTSITYIVICAVVCIICLCCSKFVKRFWVEYQNTGDNDYVGFAVVLGIILLIGLIGCTVSMCTEIFDIIKCTTFPELQLYEYITETIIPNLK